MSAVDKDLMPVQFLKAAVAGASPASYPITAWQLPPPLPSLPRGLLSLGTEVASYRGQNLLPPTPPVGRSLSTMTDRQLL